MTPHLSRGAHTGSGIADSPPMDHDDDQIQEQRTRAATKAKLAAQTEVDDIKWLMKSPRGRRILWRQLERAGVFRLSFNTNAMQMAFNEGNRNNGNHLLTLINTASPDLYMTMVTENQ